MWQTLVTWFCCIVGFSVLAYGGFYAPLVGYEPTNPSSYEEQVQWNSELHRSHTERHHRIRQWERDRRAHKDDWGVDLGPYTDPDPRRDPHWYGH